MDNQEAIQAFITHKIQIEALLRNLTALNDDHMGESPDEITWASAEFLGHIKEELEKLCRQAGLDTDEILNNE